MGEDMEVASPGGQRCASSIRGTWVGSLLLFSSRHIIRQDPEKRTCIQSSL
jgi:hypothetical protein